MTEGETGENFVCYMIEYGPDGRPLNGEIFWADGKLWFQPNDETLPPVANQCLDLPDWEEDDA